MNKYVKYPRTMHLPHSNLQSDDKKLSDDSNFIGKNVVVSLKMDGENTNLYNDYIHARSINSNSHPSRDWVKGLWASISYLIDDNIRICGENLYAKHTIKYDNLESYFMVYSVWRDNICLNWNDTVDYCNKLGLITVPVFYIGEYNLKLIESEFNKHKNEHEGYVIRLYEEFNFDQFSSSVAKYVQPEFTQTLNENNEHWLSKKIEKNELKK